MYKRLGITIFIITLLSACAVGKTPQSGSEYRKAVVGGAHGTRIDTYVVNRPYSKIAKIIKKKAKECLNKTITERHCTSTTSSTNCQDSAIIYTPTIRSDSRKTELHMQRRTEPESGIYLGGKPPATGFYTGVIDFVPAGKNKTKVVVYSPKEYFTTTPDAVKHWVNGTNNGCPDFKQGS